MLQRAVFFGVSLCLLLNLRFGFRASHYAMALLFAVFSAMVALRQIALHVLPGEGGYGTALFGLHLYTWSFIVASLIIVYSAIILGMDIQYNKFHLKLAKW